MNTELTGVSTDELDMTNEVYEYQEDEDTIFQLLYGKEDVMFNSNDNNNRVYTYI